MLVIRARIQKMLAKIAKREDPDQTVQTWIRVLKKQSDTSLHCLSRPFWQATSVQNFRTFTILSKLK